MITIHRHPFNVIWRQGWRWLSVLAGVLALIAVTALVMHTARATPGDQAYSHQIGTPIFEEYLGRSAAAADGTLWVIDQNYSRLIHTSSTGEHLATIGDGYGTDDGQFTYLVGVAAVSSGDLYTVESNGRVQRFTPSGVFVSSFTVSDVSWSVRDIAVDSTGAVYLTTNNQVKKYSSTGVELAVWGTSGGGSADGQFNYAQGLYIDAADLVYVTEYISNGRVQVFTTAGVFQRKWSASFPYDIATDSAGNAYTVVHGGALRTVQVNVASTGALVTSFTVPDAPGGSSGTNLSGISISPDGTTIFANDYRNLSRLNSEHDVIGVGTILDHAEDGLYNPRSITKDKDGNIYIYDESSYGSGDDYRTIQKYTASGTFLNTITIRVYSYDEASGDSYSIGPYCGFQIDADGNFYFGGYHDVSTSTGSTGYAIAKYAPTGGQPSFIAPNDVHDGSGNGHSFNVESFALNPNSGEFIVTGYIDITTGGETAAYYVARLSADGTQLQPIGDPRPNDGSWSANGYSVTVAPDGSLYFAGYYDTYDVESGSSASWTVWKTDANGNNRTPLIAQDATDGDITTYSQAFNVALDRDGNIYIGGYATQYNNATSETIYSCSVVKYSSNGQFQNCIVNREGSEEDIDWLNPSSLIVDQYGNVFALDQSDRVVKVYLIEPDIPSAPRNLEANPDTTSIAVTWEPPLSDGNAPITNYIIRYRVAGTTEWITAATVGADARSFTLTGLQPDTEYEIAVLERNAAGDSPLAQFTSTTASVPVDPADPEELTAPDTGSAPGVLSATPIFVGAIGLLLIAGLWMVRPGKTQKPARGRVLAGARAEKRKLNDD